MNGGIWIYAETKEGGFPEASLEILSEGRRLADLYGCRVCAVALGAGISETLDIPFLYGADRLYWSDHERVHRYFPELFTAIVAGLIRKHTPSVFLFAASDMVADLAPRVAARTASGLVTGCDRLECSPDGRLLQTRLSFGGKVHTTYVCNTTPLMATIQPGIMRARPLPSRRERDAADACSIDPDAFFHGEERTRTTRFIKADPAQVDIGVAEIIVAGGKGIGGKDGFGNLWRLGHLLGGAVAGSRMAVDNEWLGRERQIGQSGKTVSPALMISCGISGANAHLAGMRETKTLIAINRDKNSPIMKRADLAVVGDVNEVLPAMIQLLEGKSAESEPPASAEG